MSLPRTLVDTSSFRYVSTPRRREMCDEYKSGVFRWVSVESIGSVSKNVAIHRLDIRFPAAQSRDVTRLDCSLYHHDGQASVCPHLVVFSDVTN